VETMVHAFRDLILLLSLAAWARSSRLILAPLHRNLIRTEVALRQLMEADEFGEQSRDYRQQLLSSAQQMLGEIREFRLRSRYGLWWREPYPAIARLARSLERFMYQTPTPPLRSSRWVAAYDEASELFYRLSERPCCSIDSRSGLGNRGEGCNFKERAAYCIQSLLCSRFSH
jgi:hypothetical protein